MNLVPCRVCKKLISKSAKICPNCGENKPTTIKKPTNYKRLGLYFLALLIFYSLGQIFYSKNSEINDSNLTTSIPSNQVANEELSPVNNLRLEEQCVSRELTLQHFEKMQEIVKWKVDAAEPIMAYFKFQYWNSSFPTNEEKRKLVDAVANLDVCISGKRRMIYMFDSENNMIARAIPTKGIEYLF